VSVLLRIAAVIFFGWSILLGLQPFGAATVLGQPVERALANGLAAANFGFAYLFWRAGKDPPRERSAIYTAMIVLGLRAALGTYEVLYVLEGAPAMAALIDMVVCLALFVGVINTLPATLREETSSKLRGS
jgi:heme A synthase